MRTFKAILIVAGVYLVSFLVALAAAYSGATDDTIDGLSALTTLAVWGYLLSRVDYRVRDLFLLVIPFYGIFLMFRVGWRIAHLPNKDWAPHTTQETTVTKAA